MVGSKKKIIFSVVGRQTACEQFSHMNWMGVTSLALILHLSLLWSCPDVGVFGHQQGFL